MALTFNEEMACEAILRHIEARETAARSDAHSPEAEHDRDPVELVCNIGKNVYAIEHTGIEPFEGHVRLNNEANIRLDPITTGVAGKLPSDVFELHMPAMALQDMKLPELRAVQAALVLWILATGPKLPRSTYASYRHGSGSITPVGVPFAVELFRFEPVVAPGHFQIKHLVGGDRVEARKQRIARACDKKLPKLAGWKKRAGARTILIFEDNDIQLTNQAVVTDTYVPLAVEREDCPDETYLVATCMDPWCVFPILVDGKSYFEFARTGRGYWEIDQRQLASNLRGSGGRSEKESVAAGSVS